GRRPSIIPLVNEAFDWAHGVFMGASAASETTAAALHKAGVLRRDPFAMLPFCGYNMGDYFAHWLSFQKRTRPDKLPKIFFVNWFRKGPNNEWLWPGYGENSRVLKWICERVEGKGKAVETPIGYLPTPDAIDLNGLELPAGTIDELLKVDIDGWKQEVASIEEYFKTFGDKLPSVLNEQAAKLKNRLNK
ncbi:MAG: phosphoenolpyruvate carboxykinase domain-containing protein, partial [Limisphaerales bacterium]